MDDLTKTQISKLLEREKVLLGEVPPAQVPVTSQISVRKNQINETIPNTNKPKEGRDKLRSFSINDPDTLQYRKRVARLATSPSRERNIENIAPEPILANRQNPLPISVLDSPILQNEDVQNAVKIREKELLNQLNNAATDLNQNNTPSKTKKRILIDAVTPTGANNSTPARRSRISIRRQFAFVNSKNYHNSSRNMSGRPLLPVKEVRSMLSNIETPVYGMIKRSQRKHKPRFASYPSSVSNSAFKSKTDHTSTSTHASHHEYANSEHDVYSAPTTEVLSQCMSILSSAGSLSNQSQLQDIFRTIRCHLTSISIEQFRVFISCDSLVDMRDIEEIGSAGSFSLLDLHSILGLSALDRATGILGGVTQLVLDGLDPRIYHLAQLLRLDHTRLLQADADENDFEHFLCLLTDQNNIRHSGNFYFAVFIARIPKVDVPFSYHSDEDEDENEFDENLFSEIRNKQLQNSPHIAMITWILRTLFMVLRNNATITCLTHDETQLKATLFQEMLTATSRNAIDNFKEILNKIVFSFANIEENDSASLLQSPPSKQNSLHAIYTHKKDAMYQEALSITQCISEFLSHADAAEPHSIKKHNSSSNSDEKVCVAMVAATPIMYVSSTLAGSPWEVDIVTSDNRQLAERLFVPSIQRLLQSMYAAALASETNQQQYFTTMLSVQELGQEERMWCSHVFGSAHLITDNFSIMCTVNYSNNNNKTANNGTMRLIIFPVKQQHDIQIQKTINDALNHHLLNMRQEYISIYDNFAKEQHRSYDLRMKNVQLQLVDHVLSHCNDASEIKIIVNNIHANAGLSQILHVRKTMLLFASEYQAMSKTLLNGFERNEEVLYLPTTFSASPNLWTKQLLAGESLVLNDFHLLEGDDTLSPYAKDSMKSLLQQILSSDNDKSLSFKNALIIPVLSGSAEENERKLNILVLLDNLNTEDLDETYVSQISFNGDTSEKQSLFSFTKKRVLFLQKALSSFIQIVSQQLTQTMYTTQINNNLRVMAQVHNARIDRLEQVKSLSIAKVAFSKWYIRYLQQKRFRQERDISLAYNLLSVQNNNTHVDETAIQSKISDILSSSTEAPYETSIIDEGKKLIENMVVRKVKRYHEMEKFAIKLASACLSTLVTTSDMSKSETAVKEMLNDIVSFRLYSLWPEKDVYVTVENVSFIFHDINGNNTDNNGTVSSHVSQGHSDCLLLSFIDYSHIQWQLYRTQNSSQRFILRISQKSFQENAVILEIYIDKLHHQDLFTVFINCEQETNSVVALIDILLQKMQLLHVNQSNLQSLSDKLAVLSNQHETVTQDMSLLQSQHHSTSHSLHQIHVEHSYLMNILQSSLTNQMKRTTANYVNITEDLSILSEEIWHKLPALLSNTARNTFSLLFANKTLFSEHKSQDNNNNTTLYFDIIWPKTMTTNIGNSQQQHPFISQLLLSQQTSISLSELQRLSNSNILMLQDANRVYGALLLLYNENETAVHSEDKIAHDHISVTCTHILKEIYQQLCTDTLSLQVKQLTVQNHHLHEETQLRKASERLLENTLHDTTQKMTHQLQEERSLLKNQLKLLEAKLEKTETILRKEIEDEQDTVRSLADLLHSTLYDNRLFISPLETTNQMRVLNNLMLDFVHDNNRNSKDQIHADTTVAIRRKISHIHRPIESTLQWLDTQSQSRRSRMSLVSTKTLQTMLHSPTVISNNNKMNYNHLMDTDIERRFPLSTLAQSIPQLFVKIDEATSQGQTLLIDCTLYHNNNNDNNIFVTKDGEGHDTAAVIAPQVLIVPNRRIQSCYKHSNHSVNINIDKNETNLQSLEEDVAAYIFIKDEGYSGFAASDLAFLEAVCNLATLLMGLPLTLCMFATPLPPVTDTRDTEIASLRHQLAHSVPVTEYEKQIKKYDDYKQYCQHNSREMISFVHTIVQQKPFQTPATSLLHVQRLITCLSDKVFRDNQHNSNNVYENTRTFILCSRTRFHTERQFLLRQLSSSVDINHIHNANDSITNLQDETVQLLVSLQLQIGILPVLEAVLAQPHKRHVLLAGQIVVFPLPINEKEDALSAVLLFKRDLKGTENDEKEFESRSLLLHNAVMLLLERFVTTQASLTAIKHATQAIEAVSQAKDTLQSSYVAEMAKNVALTRYVQSSLCLCNETSILAFNNTVENMNDNSNIYREKWSLSSDIQRLRRAVQNVLSEVDDVLIFLDPRITSSESDVMLSTLFPPETVSPQVYDELQQFNSDTNMSHNNRLLCISDVGIARFLPVSDNYIESICTHNRDHNVQRAFRIINSDIDDNVTCCDHIANENDFVDEKDDFSSDSIQSWSLNQARNVLKQLLSTSQLAEDDFDMSRLTAGSALIVPWQFLLPQNNKKHMLSGCIVVLKRGNTGFERSDTRLVHYMCRTYHTSLLSTLFLFENNIKANHLEAKENELQAQHCKETWLKQELLDLKRLTTSIQHISTQQEDLLSICGSFSDNILALFDNTIDNNYSAINAKAMFMRFLSLFNLTINELSSGILFENTVSAMIENKRRDKVNQSLMSLTSGDTIDIAGNNINNNVRMIVMSLPTFSLIHENKNANNKSGNIPMILEIDPIDIDFLYSKRKNNVSEIWTVIVSEETLVNLSRDIIHYNNSNCSLPHVPLKHVISSQISDTNRNNNNHTICLFALRITDNYGDKNNSNGIDGSLNHSLFARVCLSLSLTRVSSLYYNKLLLLSNKLIDEKQNGIHLIQKHHVQETNLNNDIEVLTKQHLALKQAENVKNAIMARKRLVKKRIVSVCHTTINCMFNEFQTSIYDSINNRKGIVQNNIHETIDQFYSLFEQLYSSYNNSENSNDSTTSKNRNDVFKACDFGGFSVVPMKREETANKDLAYWTVSSIVTLPETEANIATLITDYLYSQYMNNNMDNSNGKSVVCVLADDHTLLKVSLLLSEVKGHTSSVLCAQSLFVTHLATQRLANPSSPQDTVSFCAFAPLQNTALLFSLPSLSNIAACTSNTPSSGSSSLLYSTYVMRCFVHTAFQLSSLLNYQSLLVAQQTVSQQLTYRLLDKNLNSSKMLYKLRKKQLKLSFSTLYIQKLQHNIHNITHESLTQQQMISKLQKALTSTQQQLADFAELQAMALSASNYSDSDRHNANCTDDYPLYGDDNSNADNDNTNGDDEQQLLREIWAKCSLTLCSLLAGHVSVRGLSLIINPSFVHSNNIDKTNNNIWIMGDEEHVHNIYEKANINNTYSNINVHNMNSSSAEEWQAVEAVSPVKRRPAHTHDADIIIHSEPSGVSQMCPAATIQRKDVSQLDNETRYIIQKLFNNDQKYVAQKIYRLTNNNINSDKDETVLLVVVGHSVTGVVSGVLKIQIMCPDTVDAYSAILTVENIALRFSATLLPLLRHTLRHSVLASEVRHTTRALTLHLASQRHTVTQLNEKQQFIRDFSKDVSLLMRCVSYNTTVSEIEQQYFLLSNIDHMININEDNDEKEQLIYFDNKKEILSTLERTMKRLCLGVSQALDCAVSLVLEPIHDKDMAALIWQEEDLIPGALFTSLLHHQYESNDNDNNKNLYSTQREQQIHKLAESFPYSLSIPLYYDTIDYDSNNNIYVGEITLRAVTPLRRDTLRYNSVLQLYIAHICVAALRRVVYITKIETQKHNKLILFYESIKKNEQLLNETLRQTETHMLRRTTLLRQVMNVSRHMLWRHSESKRHMMLNYMWYRATQAAFESQLSQLSSNISNMLSSFDNNRIMPINNSDNTYNANDIIEEILKPTKETFQKICNDYMNDENHDNDNHTVEKPLLCLTVSLSSELYNKNETTERSVSFLDPPFFCRHISNNPAAHLQHNDTLRHMATQSLGTGQSKDLRVRYHNNFDVLLLSLPIKTLNIRDNNSNYNHNYQKEMQLAEEETEDEHDAFLLRDTLIPNTFNNDNNTNLEENTTKLEEKWLIAVQHRLHRNLQDSFLLFDASLQQLLSSHHINSSVDTNNTINNNNNNAPVFAVVSLMCLVPIQYNNIDKIYVDSINNNVHTCVEDRIVSHFGSLTQCLKRLSHVCRNTLASALQHTATQLTLQHQLGVLRYNIRVVTQDTNIATQNLFMLKNEYDTRVSQVSRHFKTRIMIQQCLFEHLLKEVNALMRNKYKTCVKQLLSLYNNNNNNIDKKNVEREEESILSQLSGVTQQDTLDMFVISRDTQDTPIKLIEIFNSYSDAKDRLDLLSLETEKTKNTEKVFYGVSHVTGHDSQDRFILFVYKQLVNESDVSHSDDTENVQNNKIELDSEIEWFVTQTFHNLYRMLSVSQERAGNSVRHIFKIVKHVIARQIEDKFVTEREQITNTYESKLKWLMQENDEIQQILSDKSLSLATKEDAYNCVARVAENHSDLMSRISRVAHFLCDKTEIISETLFTIMKNNRLLNEELLSVKRSRLCDTLRQQYAHSMSLKQLKLQRHLDYVENLFFTANVNNEKHLQFHSSETETAENTENETKAFQLALKKQRDYFETQFMYKIATVLLLKIQQTEELFRLQSDKNNDNNCYIDNININDIDTNEDKIDEIVEILKDTRDAIDALRNILSHVQTNTATASVVGERKASEIYINNNNILATNKITDNNENNIKDKVKDKGNKPEMCTSVSQQTTDSDSTYSVYISLIHPCVSDVSQMKENLHSGLTVDVLTYSVSRVSLAKNTNNTKSISINNGDNKNNNISSDIPWDTFAIDNENEQTFHHLQHTLSSTAQYKQTVSRHSNLFLLPHATLYRAGNKNANNTKVKTPLPSVLETQLQLLSVSSDYNYETVSHSHKKSNATNSSNLVNETGEDVTDQLLYRNNTGQTMDNIEYKSNNNNNFKNRCTHFMYINNKNNNESNDNKLTGIRDWENVQLNDFISLPAELTQQMLSLNRDTALSDGIAEAHLHVLPINFSHNNSKKEVQSEAKEEEKGVVLRILWVRHTTPHNLMSSSLQPLPVPLINETFLLKVKTLYLVSFYRDTLPAARHIQHALQCHALKTQHATLRHKLSRVLAQQDTRLLRIQQTLEKFSSETVRYLLSNYDNNTDNKNNIINNHNKIYRHHPATLTPLQATQQRCRLALKMCLKVMRCSAVAMLIPSYKNNDNINDNILKTNMSPDKLKVMVFGNKQSLSFPSQSISSASSSEFFTITKPSEATTPVSLQMSWRHSLVNTCLKTGRQFLSRDVLTDKRYMALTDGVMTPGTAVLMSPVFAAIVTNDYNTTNTNDDNISDFKVRAVLLLVRNADTFQFQLKRSKTKEKAKKVNELDNEGLVNLMENEQLEENGFTKEELAQVSLLCSVLSLELFWCEGLSEVHAKLNRTHQQLEKLEQRLIGDQDEEKTK